MSVNVPGRPVTAELVGRGGAEGARWEQAWSSGRERGPSPWEGDRVRPLSRRQIEDRFQELGDLYEETGGSGARTGNRSRAAFLRRLAGDVRRPGFALLIAENTTLTACAYGFPVRGTDPWWQGCDAQLPGHLRDLAVGGGLFAVSGIVVPPRVRTHYQDRDWNLARRLQRRLLADHAPALGIALVPRTDTETLTAYRAWGWQDVVQNLVQDVQGFASSHVRTPGRAPERGSSTGPEDLDPRPSDPCTVLVLEC
ncbi:hypothetical protein [Streptomyces xylophagus]|uniref:hypothetical protein n=1 Tax=Streptomyces xylophagus TaxID=285514 RepID=UPI0018FE3BA9|nr:hypothetical protein [Streptomyces xylophagus]